MHASTCRCREVGVPLARTFTINPKGQIQKASTAVQSSTWSSLSAINELVDEMFPALAEASAAASAALLQAALGSSANRTLQHMGSSSIYYDTLELAASMGVVQQDAVAAVMEEAARRRSSSMTGQAGAGLQAGLGASAAADAAAAAAAAAGAAAGGSEQGTPASTPSAATAAALAAVAAAADELVPAREEFNDLHFWRTSFRAVDITDELLQLDGKPQLAAQQS
jgi:hypothetical protein